MKKAVPYFINILIFNTVFIFTIFMLPYLYVLATRNKDLNLDYNLFGVNIFTANIGTDFVNSGVGLMGIILTSLFSIFFTFGTKMLIKKIK